MLPSTPLHHLLLHDGPPLQVMTSGNRRDEPIACDDAERARPARRDRRRLPDPRPRDPRAASTTRWCGVVAGAIQPVRRARGFAPDADPVAASAATPVLAVGGQLKSTVCLARGGEAVALAAPRRSRRAEAAFDSSTRPSTKLARAGRRAAGARRPRSSSRLSLDPLGARAAALPRGRGAAPPRARRLVPGRARRARRRRSASPSTAPAAAPTGDAVGRRVLCSRDLDRLSSPRPSAPAPRWPAASAAIREPWRLALRRAARTPAPRLERAWRASTARAAARSQRLLAADRSLARDHLGRPLVRRGRRAVRRCAHEISYEAQAAIELEALAATRRARALPVRRSRAPAVRDRSAPAVRARRRRRSAGRAGRRARRALSRDDGRGGRAGCRRCATPPALEQVALSGGCFQNRAADRAELRAARGRRLRGAPPPARAAERRRARARPGRGRRLPISPMRKERACASAFPVK